MLTYTIDKKTIDHGRTTRKTIKIYACGHSVVEITYWNDEPAVLAFDEVNMKHNAVEIAEDMSNIWHIIDRSRLRYTNLIYKLNQYSRQI